MSNFDCTFCRGSGRYEDRQDRGNRAVIVFEICHCSAGRRIIAAAEARREAERKERAELEDTLT